MENPICKCCNSDEFIHVRNGGGFRCERCHTLFSPTGAVIGGQNYDEVRLSPLVWESSTRYYSASATIRNFV